MAVYVIRAGDGGPVKIGFTIDVAHRLMKMQADNHETLTVLRVIDGGRAVERVLHERFAHLRRAGEWFTFDKAMLDPVILSDASLPPPHARRGVYRTRSNRIIEQLGGRDTLSLLTGAKPNAVTQWRRIGIPARYWPAIVERATHLGIGEITFDALATTKPLRSERMTRPVPLFSAHRSAREIE